METWNMSPVRATCSANGQLWAIEAVYAFYRVRRVRVSSKGEGEGEGKPG